MTAISFALLPKSAAYKQPLRVLVAGLRTKRGEIGLRLNMADEGLTNFLFSTKTAIYDNIEYDVANTGAIKNKHAYMSPIVSNNMNKIIIALFP
jgi:hypothetical protein